MKYLRASVAIAVVMLWNSLANSDELQIEIENTAPAGGFFFTPVFLGFHDGSFDVFDSGGSTSAELELLAEGGDTSGVASLLAAQQGSSFSTTFLGDSVGPPPFDPGESITKVFNIDSTNQRFLSFASMVIPSNDAFFGNADALELFDNAGTFNGSVSIEITAGMIYDAGTEVNDINGGAAFSALGGTSVSESNPIALIDLADLNNFIGSDTASGATITSGFSPDTVVARINISAIPEPGSMVVLGLLSLSGLMRRRR